MAHICVFCSARSPQEFLSAAQELGTLLGQRKDTLVFGGSNVGTMGTIARAVQKSGGKTIGVLPEVFAHLEGPDDQNIRTKDFAQRKATLINLSDAFIIFPGGYGTLDEFTDVLIAKILKLKNSPIVFINTNNFYEHLLKHLEKIVDLQMAEPNVLFGVVNTPQEALDYIDAYQPQDIDNKMMRG